MSSWAQHLGGAEELDQALFDALPAVMAVKDSEGRYLVVNRHWEHIHGLSRDAVVGKTDAEVFQGSDAPTVCASELAVMDTGDPFASEESIILDGEQRTYYSTRYPLLDGDGTVVAVGCHAVDITERKREEALVSGSSQVLELIANRAPLSKVLERLAHVMEAQSPGMLASVLLLDDEGTHVVHGAAPSLPEAYSRAIDGEPIGPSAGSCGTAIYRGEPVIVEDILIDPLWDLYRDLALDHGLRACWSTPIVSSASEVLGTFAMYYREPRAPRARELELTATASRLAGIAIERDAAEKRLRTSEERFGAVFQSTPISILISTPEHGLIIDANEHASQALGYPKRELIGRTSHELGLWADPGERVQAMEMLRDEGKVENLEVQLRAKNGRILTQLVSIRRVELDGRACLLAAGLDITERKQAAEALYHSEEQLRQAQKMEAVGRLAGGIAHDFNNLLTAISGYTELLLERVSPEQRPDAEQILHATDRATALTKQLLAFTRRQVIQRESLDLNDVVGDIDRLLRRLLGSDVELVTVLAPEVPRVEADRSQLEQVIVNLALNARDAMPAGGKLVIETATREEAILLRVQDSGVGIPDDVRPHIFEPFFTTKEPGRGTGLGLATVLGIVEQGGGTIEFSTVAGEGTTFEIVLPAAVSPERVVEERAVEARALSGTETVLVVEDDDIIRALTVRTLREQGYDVIEARYGTEALERWAERSADIGLVLSDVVMPGMSGVELTARIAQECPEVRVMLMSGFADPAAAQQVEAPTGAGFLEKPFTPRLLLQRVRELLG